jgi:MscS family membrane protein
MLKHFALWLHSSAIMIALCWSVNGLTDASYPLQPPDLSSPRATINSFLTEGDKLNQLLSEEHWHAPSRVVVDHLLDAVANSERMFDLSEVPPAAQFELGRDGVVFLYEVLSRIALPPEADIPNAAAYVAVEDDQQTGNESISWTIPHTEITLVRISDGPRAGQFLFSSQTLVRASEFYEKVRTQPYRRNVALKNYPEMRPYLTMTGWLISSATIEGFPDWLKRSVNGQAVWKWLALSLLMAITIAVVVVIGRLVRRGLTGHGARTQLHRLATPLTLLLVPLMLNLANRQLSLDGWVSGGVGSLAEALNYFALAWISWTGSMAVAEVLIASPRIPDQSLNAHLLRLMARTFGILVVIAIIMHVSSRLGAPLYGLIAGLGVGGIALALAAQPTIENFIGGLNLFVDQPVQVGLREMLLSHPRVLDEQFEVRFSNFGDFSLGAA